MDTFSGLLALTQASEVCWGRAREFVRQFSSVPEFSRFHTADAWVLPAADSQSQQHLEHAIKKHAELLEAIEKWRAAAAPGDKRVSPLEFVNEAVGIKLEPYYIDGQSYQTAHEAAVAFAEAVEDCWRSPDCWEASVDGRVEFLNELKTRLTALPKYPDPWARLQGEYYAASELTTCGQLESKVRLANEVRDKWLYNQFTKLENDALVPQKTIVSRLREQCDTTGWNFTSDIKSLKNAANAWAERNDKPPIPKRQHGRRAAPSKSN